MKKIARFAICAAVALAFTSCGQDPKGGMVKNMCLGVKIT